MWLVLLSGWSLLLAGWLTVVWGILPHIDRWRPDIERVASQALGLSVHIDQISSQRTEAGLPVLSLRGLRWVNAQGELVLALPQAEAALSWRSLPALGLRFKQIALEGLWLDARRRSDGQLELAGLALPAAEADAAPSPALLWLLRQRELLLRHASLRWTDALHDGPALTLSDIDLVSQYHGQRHGLRLNLTPPAGWGQRMQWVGEFEHPLLAPPGDWRRWSGTLYADLPGLELSRLGEHATLPWTLHQASGGLRLWLALSHGQWRQLTADLRLDRLHLQWPATPEALRLHAAQGRLLAWRHDEGIRLEAQQLAWTAEGQAPSRIGQLWLQWQQAQSLGPDAQGRPSRTEQAAPITGGALGADQLDLAALLRLAPQLPLPDALRQRLLAHQPQGRLHAPRLSWSGLVASPSAYQLSFKGQGLALRSAHGLPGFGGLDAELHASHSGGTARLALHAGSLELTGVLEDPRVALDRLDAQLRWRVADRGRGRADGLPALDVFIDSLRLDNPDLQATLHGAWHSGVADGARLPGQLELNGRLLRLQAEQLARYLPTQLPDSLRHYLRDALQAGEFYDGQFQVQGDLSRLPFAAGDGVLRLHTALRGLRLAYGPASADGSPGWPVLHELAGALTLEGNRLALHQGQGRLWGLELHSLEGNIAALDAAPVLALGGQLRGPLADMQRFVSESPVNGWTQQALAPAQVSGPAELSLALKLPLTQLADTDVQGRLLLQGNTLRWRPELPMLTALRGPVEFDRHGFALREVLAQLAGAESVLEGGTQADGSGLRFQAHGELNLSALRELPELAALARPLGAVSGRSPYRLHLALPAHQAPELTLSSNLQGLALDLPAPLHKPPHQTLPMRLHLGPAPAEPGGPAGGELLRLELGTRLLVEYQRQPDADGHSHISRGVIGVGDSHVPAEPGAVVAALRLDALDLDAWQQRLAQLLPEAAASGPSNAADYLPSKVQLQVDRLTVAQRSFDEVNLKLQRLNGPDGPRWQAQIQSEQIRGQLSLEPPNGPPQPGRLRARLSQLNWPDGPAETQSHPATVADHDNTDTPPSTSAAAAEPTQLPPALDIIVDQLALADRPLGRLEINASHLGSGAARRWWLSRLRLTAPEARLDVSGQWDPAAGLGTALEFGLELDDSGKFLERLGGGQMLRGGRGRITGQLAWPGAALSPSWPQARGRLHIALDGGQILKVEPGVARLLGLLSLEGLSRRLQLDFRDIFQPGFAFDNISGDLTLDDGQARTNNLRVRGVQAMVLMEGQADLRQRTQQARVLVVPEINAGTASLAYAAINPAIGLGTFIAQVVLRKTLMEAGTLEFRVRGGWNDPSIEPVARRFGDTLPDELLNPPANAPAGKPPGAPASTGSAPSF